MEQQNKINANNIGQAAFLAIALIAFFLVGYISYHSLLYGDGNWNINGGRERKWQVAILFMIPILFLEIYFVYKKTLKKNIKISQAFLFIHIIASIFFLLFLTFIAFSLVRTNGQPAFSIYYSGFSFYQLIGYLLALIQAVFVMILVKRISKTR